MVGESCDVFAIQVLAVLCVKIQALTQLFVKVHTHLDQDQ